MVISIHAQLYSSLNYFLEVKGGDVIHSCGGECGLARRQLILSKKAHIQNIPLNRDSAVCSRFAAPARFLDGKYYLNKHRTICFHYCKYLRYM